MPIKSRGRSSSIVDQAMTTKQVLSVLFGAQQRRQVNVCVRVSQMQFSPLRNFVSEKGLES